VSAPAPDAGTDATGANLAPVSAIPIRLGGETLPM